MTYSNTNADEDIFIKRIVVGVDGSAQAKKALNYAVRRARGFRAEVQIAHAIKRPELTRTAIKRAFSSKAALSADELYQSLQVEASKWMEDYAKDAKSLGLSNVSTKILSEEGKSEVQMIIDYALAVKADMIVTGSRGSGTFKQIVLGSIANGVASHAFCPVLVVR